MVGTSKIIVRLYLHYSEIVELFESMRDCYTVETIEIGRKHDFVSLLTRTDVVSQLMSAGRNFPILKVLVHVPKNVSNRL